MGEDRGHVAGEEALAVTESDHEGHVLAGSDEPVALAPVHDGYRVGALTAGERRAHRRGQVAVVGLLHKVRQGLGVRLRGERVAARFELVAQLPEVLDDPGVDHRDLARAVLVGMGIEVVGAAVGRPAGVCEPDRRMWRAVGNGRRQVGELARLLLDEQVARVIHEGDTGRVVAAILQALESGDENGARLARSRVANDAAHPVRFLRSCPDGSDR